MLQIICHSFIANVKYTSRVSRVYARPLEPRKKVEKMTATHEKEKRRKRFLFIFMTLTTERDERQNHLISFVSISAFATRSERNKIDRIIFLFSSRKSFSLSLSFVVASFDGTTEI